MAQGGWNLDLTRCVGCSACAVSCKSENNTMPSTTDKNMEQLTVRYSRNVQVNYREVLSEETGTYPNLVKKYISMACNHCANPACLAACPVGAITKESTTTGKGLVQIDQDKCIGCRYCESACPYGAPQYNEWTRKVEKCTGCKHRLDAGLLPACATTCVGKALNWTDDFQLSDGHGTVPTNFADPALTHPSIIFTT